MCMYISYLELHGIIRYILIKCFISKEVQTVYANITPKVRCVYSAVIRGALRNIRGCRLDSASQAHQAFHHLGVWNLVSDLSLKLAALTKYVDMPPQAIVWNRYAFNHF